MVLVAYYDLCISVFDEKCILAPVKHTGIIANRIKSVT